MRRPILDYNPTMMTLEERIAEMRAGGIKFPMLESHALKVYKWGPATVKRLKLMNGLIIPDEAVPMGPFINVLSVRLANTLVRLDIPLTKQGLRWALKSGKLRLGIRNYGIKSHNEAYAIAGMRNPAQPPSKRCPHCHQWYHPEINK